MAQYVNRRMIVEKESPSKEIRINGRLPNVASGNLYAIIIDEKGNHFIKQFAYIQNAEIINIDFDGEIPDGFFFPGRTFHLEIRKEINGPALDIELISSTKSIFVTNTDDTLADSETQTIGTAI